MFLQINLNKLCISYILPFLKIPMPLWLQIPETWLYSYKEHIFSFSPLLLERGGQFQDKLGGLLQILSYSAKVLAVKLFFCAVLEVGDLEWPSYTVFLSVFQMFMTVDL